MANGERSLKERGTLNTCTYSGYRGRKYPGTRGEGGERGAGSPPDGPAPDVADRIEADADTAVTIPTDVSDPEQVDTMVETGKR